MGFSCARVCLLVNVCPLMGFALRAGIFFIGLALLVSISCDKHHLGEYPEVQRDRLEESNHKTEQGGVPAATATPVKFFPEKKTP